MGIVCIQYIDCFVTVCVCVCVCVFSGGQETELISRSAVTRYQRPKQQEHTADSELVNSGSSSVSGAYNA